MSFHRSFTMNQFWTQSAQVLAHRKRIGRRTGTGPKETIWRWAQVCRVPNDGTGTCLLMVLTASMNTVTSPCTFTDRSTHPDFYRKPLTMRVFLSCMDLVMTPWSVYSGRSTVIQLTVSQLNNKACGFSCNQALPRRHKMLQYRIP